jgi:membrane associated rhomboid family serine protease
VTKWVQRLLIANVGVFFLQQTLPAVTYLGFYVPSEIITRPWTVITYMFLHGGVMHILFNMIGLYFFGPRVEQRLGSDRFVQLYFASGITGALLSSILAPNAALVGASAAIFGIMFAYASFWPRDQVLIWGILPVEVRWLVVGSTVLALWSGLQGSRGGVADFAHLGGYVGAFIFLRLLNRGNQQFKAKAAAPPPQYSKLRNWQQVNLKGVHDINKEEVNRILDKINAEGIGSLTAQEKTFLSNFVAPCRRPERAARSARRAIDRDRRYCFHPLRVVERPL